MAEQLAVPAPGRNLKTAIRYVLGVILGLVVLVLLVGKRGELMSAWRQLRDASPAWVLLAILAEATSLLAFAWLQHRVLRLSGARIRMPALFLLTLANDAIANTVPGEPAVSSAYRYRYYRRHGATGASAGWTIFTILIAQAIGMSALLLIGVLVALTSSTSTGGAGTALVGLVIVVAAGAVLVRRDVVLGLAASAVRGVRRLTGHPRGSVGARIEATFARMQEIPLSTPSTVGVVAIATAVWCCDFLCLICAFGAVHAKVPWHGVLLAYGVAQIVASFPVVPGGIGIVEGSLAVILAAYGAGRVPAVSAALGFRIINFWLAIIVGWISVAAIALLARRRGDTGSRVAPGGDLEAAAVAPPQE